MQVPQWESQTGGEQEKLDIQKQIVYGYKKKYHGTIKVTKVPTGENMFVVFQRRFMPKMNKLRD